MQITIGKGGNGRRLIFWPRFGHIGLRVFEYWWLSLYWRSRPRWIDVMFPGWIKVR